MERITRTLELVEIEGPNGEVRLIVPSDVARAEGWKVLGRKCVLATMPVSTFIENATIREV